MFSVYIIYMYVKDPARCLSQIYTLVKKHPDDICYVHGCMLGLTADMLMPSQMIENNYIKYAFKHVKQA